MDVSTALNNPLEIQRIVLDEYISRIDEQDVEIADANNAFSFLLETTSQIVAQATNVIDNKLSALYPIRASTTENLYNHISDYEYVGFFSYPAPLKLTMMLHRDYLVKNAVAVAGTNYKLVIIPADTIFTIGRFQLGLYYPIHIKINTLINTISVSYDTTDENPLKSLATNTIEVKADNFNGINLISFEFDTYQFNKVTYTESINPKIGFIKKYQYNNKFYAIRVFDISSGSKVELNYTLSDAIYDTSKATVILKILPEENAITVNLPQIYLTNGKVGTKLQLEIYDTLGAIDASIVNVNLEDITANFAMNNPNTDLTYTNILRTIPTIIIQPSNTRITGGSNNMSFDEIKDYTIYHNNELSVPITRMDLNKFFSKNGFSYMAKLDNLTDRRYYAYRKMYNGDEVLGVTNSTLTIPFDEDTPNTSILYQNNESIVILPTTIYNYNSNTNKFLVLSDTEANVIRNSNNTDLANILNNGNHFGNPHHIVITTADRYPSCSFYDLFTTKATNVTFLEENVYLSAQLSLVSVVIRHLNNGAGGYVIRVGMQRSEDIQDTEYSLLKCCLTATSKEGYRVGLVGTYINTYNGIDVFDFTLTTNYKISKDRITLTNMKTSDDAFPDEYEIDLSGIMHIATFVKKSLFPSITQNEDILSYSTDDDGSWLAVSLQKFEYSLGNNLDDVIDANLLTTWTPVEFRKYEVDVPLLYDHDVYETNEDGTLKYTIVGDEITLNKIHSIGDVVYADGEIVYQHRIGDTLFDASGNTVEVSSRMKEFTLTLNGYEYSHNSVITDFHKTLSATLSSYYDTIREMDDSVLENTNIFFSPLITTNAGYYKINNSTTITSSLELSFEFNCYVSQATLDDEVLLSSINEKINNIVISHLSDTIISLTVIAADVKNTLSAYVNSIDCLSLNGMNDVQTLMNINVDKSPKIGRKLVVGSDGRLVYEPLITINFKALDL